MNAIGIVCSPRKHGNSDVLVREVLKFTGSENFEVFYPNEMNIRGCQACYSCKEQGKCAVKDDMQEIYEGIEKSDVIVFGTPIYMAGTAAQFKLVLDRLFAFLGPAPKFESRIP
ncbi:MAG: flavodoxin family protein, partial [Acetomicrobium sp.]